MLLINITSLSTDPLNETRIIIAHFLFIVVTALDKTFDAWWLEVMAVYQKPGGYNHVPTPIGATRTRPAGYGPSPAMH